MHALQVNGLNKAVGLSLGERLQILRDVNLSVHGGELVAVVGRSGSGKSTLLAMLGLLARPDSGAVYIAGHDTAGLTDSARSHLRSAHIGFVFQNYSLLPHLTAAQNVALPFMQGKRVPAKEIRLRVDEGLASVGLDARRNAYPRQLSGGEQQRVAVARALVRKPRVILADEPTGSLDEATAEDVLDLLIGEARGNGTALVLVTHDVEVAARADRVMRLRDGTLHDSVA
ncbi:ABC transporter ATP-binding protein [Micromonospora sp. DT229]|uniref:ABC transporter ATP-binding protein n=1 Tax=Micromonospora sp. DT229 TaxID=3393430 RepID=UPI003CF57E69